jgi:putative transposase
MDFVADQLFDGRKFRALTIVDNFSRFCLGISIGKSIKGIDVVKVLEALKTQQNLLPQRIQVDNGSEFISKDFDKWAYENKVTLDYSRPGTPTDNPFIESFNGSFRDECLNTHWFLSIDDAYEKINDWVYDYNNYRPHSSLNELTPNEYVQYYQNNNINGEILPEATNDEGMFMNSTKIERINQKNIPSSSVQISSPMA